jgi:hypothetical protein
VWLECARKPDFPVATAEKERKMETTAEEETEREFDAAARAGRLAQYLETHPEAGNAVLYRIVSELVYKRLTQPAERGRGHQRCAVSVNHLEPDCHDRHQDDVEAVRADLLRHADKRIENPRGWLVPRLKPVTIDAHRRRRGDQGAQQRPRLPLPGWLDAALGGDPWLSALAVEILVWVGVPTAVANGIWPLGAWAERRAQAVGEPGATEARVAVDVERVLAAMRTNQGWYDKYVERPLGRKQAPAAPRARGDAEYLREPAFLPAAAPDEIAEARLAGLAGDAIDAVEARVKRGEDLRSAVVGVLGAAFGGGTGADEMDCPPGAGSGADERVVKLLADPATIDRIAAAFLDIIKGR